jgi:hypothetical protein
MFRWISSSGDSRQHNYILTCFCGFCEAKLAWNLPLFERSEFGRFHDKANVRLKIVLGLYF